MTFMLLVKVTGAVMVESTAAVTNAKTKAAMRKATMRKDEGGGEVKSHSRWTAVFGESHLPFY